MRVTARHVAQAAGTSLAAVSRAFSPNGAISEEKRQRILQASKELGYVSPAGRSISNLAMGSISLVAGDLTNPFYVSALDLLALGLHERGKRLILHTIPPGGSVDLVMQQVLSYRADAAIVTSARMSSEIARTCRRERMPVVLLNRVQPDADMAAVTCDNYNGARLVAAHLAGAGRRRIGHVTGMIDTSTHIERNRGFLDRLAEEGLAPAATVCGAFTYNAAHAAIVALLRDRPDLDALFCENDVMALAAVDVARASGRRVGEDIAILGFDDIAQAGWESYRLTTLRQPIRRMVTATLDLVDRLIADPEQGAIRVIPGHLVIRATG